MIEGGGGGIYILYRLIVSQMYPFSSQVFVSIKNIGNSIVFEVKHLTGKYVKTTKSRITFG